MFSTQYYVWVSDYSEKIITSGSVGLRDDQKFVLKVFFLFKNTIIS